MSSGRNFDYVSGSTARKYDYLYDNEMPTQEKVKKIVKPRPKPKQKVNLKTVFVVACCFTMLLVTSFRFNLISESNLQLQMLKNELERAQSNLAAAAMDVEQNTNLSEIESYAKQKLGMQKPDKNQVVYIDTSSDANVVKEENLNFVEQIMESVKELLNKIK